MQNNQTTAKSSKKKWIFIIVTLVIISGIGTVGYIIFNNSNTSKNTETTASTTPAKIAPENMVADGSTTKDIAYATASTAQKLDLYLPSTGKTSYPVVVYIHGGAFISGDKASGMDMSTINQIVSHGYAVASINYRLSSEAKYPAQINDAKAAVRWLKANAAQYRLNTEKVASWGGSAGGNLSSLLGTTSGVAELEGADLGNSNQSSKVIASVDWFGPINFLTMDSQAQAQGFTINTNSSSSPESMLMGAPVQTVPDKVATANAMAYATKDDAAFYIQNGTADKNIPAQQSVDLYNKMIIVKGLDNVKYDSIQGAGHGGAQFTQADNMAKIFAFLDKYLQ
jgi:dipeptidyl aminopeptidase/acylaminoacyl peptidase